MKILVLGASGMLGHKVFQALRQRFPETYGTIRGGVSDLAISQINLFQHGHIIEEMDAADFPALKTFLRLRQPEVVVNCVGVVKQRNAAKDAVTCITINSLLPHHLANVCGEWGGRVIHISTDCVFNGQRSGGQSYTEDDPADADDLYGMSKRLGEITGKNALTLRTSVIGRELNNFGSLLEWLLGYRRSLYSGVTTNHLAEVVGDIIEHHPTLSGLYQVAGHTISKYKLLHLIREAFHLYIEITPDEVFFCNRSLSGEKFHRATGYVCPSWPELIEQLAKDTTPYQNWKAWR
jgi:dTDP-4-dehydrorhamnose reductase